jgi:hypothetical protein
LGGSSNSREAHESPFTPDVGFDAGLVGILSVGYLGFVHFGPHWFAGNAICLVGIEPLSGPKFQVRGEKRRLGNSLDEAREVPALCRAEKCGLENAQQKDHLSNCKSVVKATFETRIQ